jgi:hypothetical protein
MIAFEVRQPRIACPSSDLLHAEAICNGSEWILPVIELDRNPTGEARYRHFAKEEWNTTPNFING